MENYKRSENNKKSENKSENEFLNEELKLEEERQLKRKESRKLNLGGRYSTDWICFEDYQLKEDKNGDLYVVPSSVERLKIYNPFDLAEELLIDTLKLGDAYNVYKNDLKNIDGNAYKKRKVKKNWEDLKAQLLDYVKSYGLLGLISSSTYNRNVIGDKDVLIMERNSLKLKERIMDTQAYMALFTPFAEKGDLGIEYHKNVGYLVKYEDTPRFYGKRPMVMDLIFSGYYAEKVEWIFDYVSMLAKHYNQLMTYKTKASRLTEPVTILANEFEASKIGFTINQADKTVIAWAFDSLKTTIQTIYGFSVTDENIKLKRCENCDGFYFAVTAREKYCSAACRNRSNVRKTRQRQKEIEEVDKEEV